MTGGKAVVILSAGAVPNGAMDTMPKPIPRLVWADLPPAVQRRAVWLVRDLVAASLPGAGVASAAITAAHVERNFRSGGATILASGARSTVSGAALANGMLSDALSLNDGHVLAKGHPGANIIPAVLAAAEEADATLSEFLASVVFGYELAVRAAMDLHARSPVYRAAGAWGPMASAAAICHLRRLSDNVIRHAIGFAEFHAPHAPLLPSLSQPAMTKDAIGWGAFLGATAAELAEAGFTAHDSEFFDADPFEDIGRTWRCLDGYVKPFPVIRLSQPAIKAALDLRGRHALDHHRIARVAIRTFANSANLPRLIPTVTEEAQYGLPWPVAYALVHGRFDVQDVIDGLSDPDAAALMGRIEVSILAEYDALYPAKRVSDVSIETDSGELFNSDPVTADGDAGDPGWEDIIEAKFRAHVGLEPDDLDAPLCDRPLGRLPRDELIAAICRASGPIRCGTRSGH